MAVSGPKMSEYLEQKYEEAGGQRPKPQSDDNDEEEDNDDEPHGVLLSGFEVWYPPFIQACEDKKRDEYLKTKELKAEELAEYWGERPLHVRSAEFPPLEGPQDGLAATKASAQAAAATKQEGEAAEEAKVLQAARRAEGRGAAEEEMERVVKERLR